jgi:hypothetical protein
LEKLFFHDFAVADHISLTVRENGRFGPLLEKKYMSLVAPGS